MGVHGILVLDGLENLGTVDSTTALLDDGITDLANKYNEASWRVVVLGVVPNEQDGVHDWHEAVENLRKVLRAIREIKEKIFQGRKVLEVLVCLLLRNLDLLLQLAEGSCVGTLVLLQEFKNLLDAF